MMFADAESHPTIRFRHHDCLGSRGGLFGEGSVMNALRSQSLPNTDFKDPEQVLASPNAAFPREENSDMFFTI
jgi:serine phosphatase RsbU (regulator of sigma subunit)